MFSSCAVREVEGRCLIVGPSSRVSLRELVAYSLNQLHEFCSCGRFRSARCSSVTTGVGSIGHALAAQDWRSWPTNGPRLDENLIFQAAEPTEEEGNHDSFSYSKDK